MITYFPAMAGAGAVASPYRVRFVSAPLQNSTQCSRSSRSGVGNGNGRVACVVVATGDVGIEVRHAVSSKFGCLSSEILLQERRRQKSFRYAVKAAAAESKPTTEKPVADSAPKSEPSKDSPPSANDTPEPAPPKKPPKPTMKKGTIVRVDKEKYLDSVEYYAVDHPKYYKGIDYIYEDRGEILDVRFFEAGEYALVSWAGIPTSPAWLPVYMLIQAEKLSYKRE